MSKHLHFPALAVLLWIAAPAGTHAGEVFPETKDEPQPLDLRRAATLDDVQRLRRSIPKSPPTAVALQLTASDIRAMRRYNEQSPPGRPPRVGAVKVVDIDVDFGLSPASQSVPIAGRQSVDVTEQSAAGNKAWALRLDASNTGGARVRLEDLRLPNGAQLYLYNDSGDVRGPYEGHHESLWTHSIGGGAIYLQVDYSNAEPATVDQIRFRIREVLLLDPSPQTFCPFNAPCIEDGSCYDTEDWAGIEDARRGVASILFIEGPNAYLCSGGLLADTDPSTFIPYFITANHCISTDAVASTMEARFDLRTNACGGECTWPSAPSTIGASLLHTSSATDHSLLQLTQPPPDGAVFLGWSNEPVAMSNDKLLYRLSHPKGAPQAFSSHRVDTTAPVCLGLSRGEFIYSRDTIGGIEAGSSGSPLMTADAQVVGQLFGSCGMNIWDLCDSVNNATVDGAFADYYEDVAPWLDPATKVDPTPPDAALLLSLPSSWRWTNMSTNRPDVTASPLPDDGPSSSPKR